MKKTNIKTSSLLLLTVLSVAVSHEAQAMSGKKPAQPPVVVAPKPTPKPPVAAPTPTPKPPVVVTPAPTPAPTTPPVVTTGRIHYSLKFLLPIHLGTLLLKQTRFLNQSQ